MKKIEKSILINAPAENVWQVLTDDALNRQWYAEFMEGSHAVTDWKQGSRATFLDNEKNGITGIIKEIIPNKSIVIEFDGQVLKGEEDFDSEEVKKFIGGQETYKLVPENGSILLNATSDMDESYFDSMNESWNNAIIKIKELSEKL